MKKSQITIFIVLGITVTIIFGLLFFISRQTSEVVLEKRIDKVYGDFLRSTDIEYITNNCLDKTTKEALFLVGIQGGRIYDYQIDNGYSIDSDYDVIPFNYTKTDPEGVIYNVGYGIKAPTTLPYPNPPDYPYLGSLVWNVSKELIPGFFVNPNNQLFAGISEKRRFTILADLCNKLGPNNPYIEGAGISCETYSTKNESVQEYIKRYIEQNIRDCINFTSGEIKGYNISAEDLSLTVLIGETDLLVSLRYPIEISIKEKPPITKYLDFNIRPKIRLKILHEIASHLIGYNLYTILTKADSNNIFFNITRDDPNDCYKGTDPCILPGINVFKLKDYCLNHDCGFYDGHYIYSDILVIEDNESVIDGEPYRFQFAIENRRPALDFIDESVGPDKYYYWYVNETSGKNLAEVYNEPGYGISDSYNIVANGGGVLKIYALGVDPDEGDLTYKYTIPDGKLLEQPFPNEIWVNTGRSDFNVIINVSDNEGLYDYQDVKIKVV